MNRYFTVVLSSVVAIALAAGCATSPAAEAEPTANTPLIRARATMMPTEGNTATGSVSFHEVAGGVRVIGAFAGLAPGAHGFHVHEKGDCSSPDGTSAGGHFNPGGHPHALPTVAMRHAGDLGNLVADETGHAALDQVFTGLALRGENSALGRGLIVHAEADDGGQPVGNAGARVACGVVTAEEPPAP